MRWSKVEEIYGPELSASFVFDPKTDEGRERVKELHKRVIEHVRSGVCSGVVDRLISCAFQNIRVIAQYYTKISIKRMMQLLDLSQPEAEEHLSKLVVSKTIWARIDRPVGIVNFEQKRDANGLLNEWSKDVKDVLELIAKTGHYIAKEEMNAALLSGKSAATAAES